MFVILLLIKITFEFDKKKIYRIDFKIKLNHKDVSYTTITKKCVICIKPNSPPSFLSDGKRQIT